MILPALDDVELVVTGVDGFVGHHVARLAAEAGARVHGLSRAPQVSAELAASLESYHSVDLRTEWPGVLRPDAIIHLAGRAAVGPSFDNPQGYITDNSAMVTVMCEALLRQGNAPRIVGVSTGALYAPTSAPDPLTEHSAVSCPSPYAVSKLLVEHQFAYYRARGLDTVIARPFNHIGPGQGPGFLVPDLMGRLRVLPADATLTAGDLTTARDYTDVRDIARAYLLLTAAITLQHGVYNVASGKAIQGAALLEALCAALGREVPEVEIDPAFVRPTDARLIVGSADRLRDELGWTPSYQLRETIVDAVKQG